jgi:hypothetical protein
MSKSKSESKSESEISCMTAETIGKDLLYALVQEIQLLPNVWPKLSEAKQDGVIERLRKRVSKVIGMAVYQLAAQGRTGILGELEQITIKDGVKAVVKIEPDAENLHCLYEAAGQPVLVVIANPDDNLGGMDEIKGEADQRAMDLGHEYNPNGDGEGMGK